LPSLPPSLPPAFEKEEGIETAAPAEEEEEGGKDEGEGGVALGREGGREGEVSRGGGGTRKGRRGGKRSPREGGREGEREKEVSKRKSMYDCGWWFLVFHSLPPSLPPSLLFLPPAWRRRGTEGGRGGGAAPTNR